MQSDNANWKGSIQGLGKVITMLVTIGVLFAVLRNNRMPYSAPPLDLYWHCASFFVLTLSWRLSFRRFHILLIAGGAALLAMSTELYQDAFLSQRSGDWGDFFANVAGIGLALLVLASVQGLQRLWNNGDLVTDEKGPQTQRTGIERRY